MSLFDWLFRNRTTGEITIGQAPNASIVVFAAAWLVRHILAPSGWVGTALDVVVTVAITIWALDEIIRGVNPWRRILGTVVLGIVAFGLVAHLCATSPTLRR